MASVRVFGLPAFTDVARVLACLFEKDVEFQLIRVDTFKGDRWVPEFPLLQDPSGQITFNDGNNTLVDSREICRYVCKKYAEGGGQGLLGTGTLERYSIEQWLQAEARRFDPASSALIFHLAFADPMGMYRDLELIKEKERELPIEEKERELSIEEKERKLARELSIEEKERELAIEEKKRELYRKEKERELSKVLDWYERRLRGSEFLAGDEFTLADLSHLPNLHYLMKKSERGRKLFEERENVQRWWEAISGRPSWKKVAKMQSNHPGWAFEKNFE